MARNRRVLPEPLAPDRHTGSASLSVSEMSCSTAQVRCSTISNELPRFRYITHCTLHTGNHKRRKKKRVPKHPFRNDSLVGW